VTEPSGISRTAAPAPRDANAMRSETNCKGGAPTPDVARALLGAPAQGLAGAAGGKNDRGTPNRVAAAKVYGALDLGTNNCRLLVARPSRRGFLVIDAFSRIIRLGEGVLRSGRLSDAAMSRTVDALRVCSDKLRRRGVSRSRLIATEACRIAENSGEFIERVRTETGLSIEIVSRETEAKLAVSGCASLIDRNADWALVFDIGGGSSELIWLDLSNLQRPWRRSLFDRLDVQNSIAAWTSLPVGVVSLAERHGGRDVTPEGYEAMVRDVMQSLAAFEAQHRFGERTAGCGVHFLGTSGTVTTIAGIHLALPVYERSRVDGCWLGAGDVRDVSHKLLAMSYAERTRQPCIGH
jgi:exopolyphosphatase/guanosine-5'-triphosphate,3'-diphosphate pyrophosphatase